MIPLYNKIVFPVFLFYNQNSTDVKSKMWRTSGELFPSTCLMALQEYTFTTAVIKQALKSRTLSAIP